MGGVAGHMSHLHEDLDLTFSKLIEIINTVASAKVEPIEKVDGQNIFLSINQFGIPVVARNLGDIKKGGMTPVEYAAKWKDHPAENAFMNGYKAIIMALNDMSLEEKMSIFDYGKRYVNMEIMYPPNPNIINYGASYVVVHELQTFVDAGSRIHTGNEKEGFELLKEKINKSEATVDNETWQIYGPQIIPLKNIADSIPHNKATNDITKIAEFTGGIEMTIGDYSKIIFGQLCEAQGLDATVIAKLIDIAYGNDETSVKSKKLRLLKKTSPEHAKTISLFGTKTNSKKVILGTLIQLERIISDFAIEVLRGLKSFYVVDHDKAVLEMRNELETSIQQLRGLAASGDKKMGQLLNKQLEKLGKIENVASSAEGIVFEINNKLYKMTGTFAMVNQLIGRARRIPKLAQEETQITESYLRRLIRESLKKVLSIF